MTNVLSGKELNQGKKREKVGVIITGEKGEKGKR